jgi:hypothetical protein
MHECGASVTHAPAAAPADLAVVPVQFTPWLGGVVHLGSASVVIKPSNTVQIMYIFIPKATWAKFQSMFGAELDKECKLTTQKQKPEDALNFML